MTSPGEVSEALPGDADFLRRGALPILLGLLNGFIIRVIGINAIVDYAHTPDALEKALEALRAVVRSTAPGDHAAGTGGG